MNFERDEECGAAPGVMGHLSCTNRNCSCHSSAEPVVDNWPWQGNTRAAKDLVEIDYSYLEAKLYSRPEQPPKAIKYAFIKKQTDKAILFALNDEHGLYEKWVPKSVITDLNKKSFSVQSWFYNKNW